MKDRESDSVIQHKLIGTRSFCRDIDALRKEEWKRRRLLRLEQVRQQSKDIASDIRRKVRLEKDFLEEEIKKENQVSAARWKERKLTALQNELTETLSAVGTAHKQAESQANQEAEKRQLKFLHVEAADKRGREAISRLRSDEMARKRTEEAKKLHQSRVRSVEDARAAVVVSLPLPESTVPVGKVIHSSKAAAETKEKESSTEQSKKQWPSGDWSVSVPLGVAPRKNDINRETCPDGRAPRTTKIADDKTDPPTSSRLSASVEKTTSENPAPRKHDLPLRQPPSRSVSSGVSKLKSLSQKSGNVPRGVELYDCCNITHVQYVKPAAAAKTMPPEPINGAEAAEACVANTKIVATHENIAKRVQRGRVALMRVQARREHQSVLSDLAGLVRQQATLRAFLPSQNYEPEKTQAKLNKALMDILNTTSSPTLEDEESILERTLQSAVDETESMVKETPHGTETIDDIDESVRKTDEAFLSKESSERRPSFPSDSGVVRTERTAEIRFQKERAGSAADFARVTLSDKLTGKGEEDIALRGEMNVSSSTSSDAPKLNLALWTSLSPGSTDPGDLTLTPTSGEKPDEPHSPSLTSSVPQSTSSGEEIGRTPKSPSENSSIPTKSTVKNQPAQRTVLEEKHIGSGDFFSNTEEKPVPPSSTLKAKTSSELAKTHIPRTGAVDVLRQASAVSGKSRKRLAKKDSPSSSGSTSYMSLPNKLLSALTDDLRSLLSLTRRRKMGHQQTNPLLAHYINRLLDMSRQSVERLNVTTSEVPTPPSTIFRKTSNESSSGKSSSVPVSYFAVSDVSSASAAEKSSGRTDNSKSTEAESSIEENSDLVDVMRQCHSRITTLSEMIDQVRRENAASTPVGSRASPYHMDSTTYLSPPPIVHPSRLLLPQTTENLRSSSLNDTYSTVISRLISEIRQQLNREAEKPLQIRLTPPGAMGKSAINVKSPSSNDLSTIPEQDSSPLDWSSLRTSDTTDSADDLEKEFGLMGLGWAEATLRKTKEARTLDSNSSSDFLELSALSIPGNYSHSTPIKAADDKNVRSLDT